MQIFFYLHFHPFGLWLTEHWIYWHGLILAWAHGCQYQKNISSLTHSHPYMQYAFALAESSVSNQNGHIKAILTSSNMSFIKDLESFQSFKGYFFGSFPVHSTYFWTVSQLSIERKLQVGSKEREECSLVISSIQPYNSLQFKFIFGYRPKFCFNF